MSEPKEIKIELDETITLHDLFTKSMETWPQTFFRDVIIEYQNNDSAFNLDQKHYLVLRKVTK